MCGFTAYLQMNTISKDGDTVAPVLDLGGALDLINHRGPDARGIYISPDGRCGLGHARLSIIDLEGGHQPMSNMANTIHSVVNGELYDHERLTRELEAQGHQFKTKSDSELALHYYEDHDTDFVEHLRGEFAVAIWDEKRRRMVVARDRFGIKPVYYTTIQGTFLVASEIKAFLALGWKPEWDVSSIINNGAAADSRTCFKGVYKLPAAHYMTISSSGSICVKQYWDAEYPNKHVEDARSVDEMVQGVRKRLMEAIRLRLRADVPIGVYLSGGLDSSSIAGIVTHLLRQTNPTAKVDAFTISFTDGKQFDEGDIAERTAEFCGANFHRVNLQPQDMVDHFVDTVWHVEQPVCSFNSVGKYILSKRCQETGIKVVLTGEGSDEHFLGYEFFHRDYVLEPDHSSPGGFGRPSEERRKAILKDLTDDPSMMGIRVEEVIQSTTASRWNNVLMQDYYASLLNSPVEMYKKQVILDNGVPDSAAAMLESISPLARSKARKEWHPAHASLYLESRTFLPNILLNALGDRVEMAASLEARVPFLDHELCIYANSLPPSVKIRGDGKALNEKWVLKEAVKPFVTEEIYNRTKHPFIPPPAISTPEKRHPSLQLMDKYLTKKKVGRLGWARWSFVQEQRKRFLETSDRMAFKNLLTLVSFVIMGELFGVATYQV